jgi:acyl-CoA thioesterase I
VKSSRRLSFAAAAFVACTAIACSDAGKENTESVSAAAPPKPAILFLGDSLTAGYRLELSQSPPALIEQKINAAGMNYSVINGGRSGDTSAGGLSRLGWYLRPETGVKVLVIGLGSNDAIRGLPLADLEKNLREIVRRARAFDPEMKIFLFQMHTFPNMGPRYAGDYEKIFGAVARAENITLLPFPLTGVAGKPALNQADGIHPTAEGARIMADAL